MLPPLWNLVYTKGNNAPSDMTPVTCPILCTRTSDVPPPTPLSLHLLPPPTLPLAHPEALTRTLTNNSHCLHWQSDVLQSEIQGCTLVTTRAVRITTALLHSYRFSEFLTWASSFKPMSTLYTHK